MCIRDSPFPSIQVSPIPSPFPFLSPCHELVRIFTLSLEELCLKIVRECSVHLRMVSVPIYIWLLPKSSRWSVSSLDLILRWLLNISFLTVVTSIPENWRTAVVIPLLSTLRLDLVYNNQLSSSRSSGNQLLRSFPEASKKPCTVPSQQHLAYLLCGAGALKECFSLA